MAGAVGGAAASLRVWSAPLQRRFSSTAPFESGAEARALQTLRDDVTRMARATPPFVRYGYFVV